MTASASTATDRVIPILSAANFVIGMGAFMLVGLLNPLAQDLAMTAPQAGMIMVVYAMAYAVLSPLLVSLTGRIGRRRLLASALLIFALSCLMAAFAPDPATIFLSRVVAAAGAGLVTPVSAAVAAGLSPPGRRASALAAVFFGLTLAQVLGVPAGSFIAYTFGWRPAFGLVAVLALPVIWGIWVIVPAGLGFAPVGLADLGRTLANLRHMLAIGFTSFFLGAIYIIYTYIAPLLATTMGFGRDGITLALLMFGVGAVAGNLAGGRLTDRIGAGPTLALLAVGEIAIMPVFSLLPFAAPGFFALCFVWAAIGWSFMAAQQERLIGLDPANAQVMLALNAASIYVGAAAGSAVGAAVVSSAGLGALGIAGGAGAFCALAILLLSFRMNRPRST
ncbi:MAG: MFS transporter [Rhodobacteraceae bacterium]|nr:MFS transporter [Paracoccaceae bacterium]